MRHDLANHLQQLPAEQIKQAIITWLDTDDAEVNDLEQLLSSEIKQTKKIQERSTEEKLAAFHEWVESHRGEKFPLLSDEAISRESIYEDRV